MELPLQTSPDVDGERLVESIGRDVDRDGGAARLLDEDVALPAVNLVDNNLALEVIVADLGKNDGPDKPVNGTGSEQGEGDNNVNPVGQALVDAVAVGVGDEGSNDEVDVAGQEEQNDGKAGREGRVPVPLLAVEVEVGQASGDENVDDRQGVDDEARGGSAE